MFHEFVVLKSQLRVKDSIGLLTISDRNPLDNEGDITSEPGPSGSGRRNPGTGPGPFGPEPQTAAQDLRSVPRPQRGYVW